MTRKALRMETKERKYEKDLKAKDTKGPRIKARVENMKN